MGFMIKKSKDIHTLTLDGRVYVMVPQDQWAAVTRKHAAKPQMRVKLPPPAPDGTYTLEHVRISLAKKMAARRKSAGLTQVRLAALAGVRVETISRLENGRHMPGTRTFDKIERALRRRN
jgi:DNA-binding XRE family transcriptional regulator